MLTFRSSFLLGLLAGLAACSSADKKPAEDSDQLVVSAPAAVMPAATPTPATPTPAAAAPPVETAPPAPAAGFDLAAVPVAPAAKLGAWPYFSLLEGYKKGDAKGNMEGEEAKKFLQDAAFDRYEFFDGTKMIPVEGRLYTTKALGEGASFFQVQKTYEKLVHDLGGVTVWEGDMGLMDDLKLKYAESRHRAQYLPKYEKAGVYMVRLPEKEIWVEAYQIWDDHSNYWLTVLERKALPMMASVLPATELKKALDATGHVALYLNFDTDQATLKPDAQASVAQVIALLSQNPALRLSVEGHTDNAGTPAHNQQLSEARARTVVATLTAQGIVGTRLQAVGFGQTKPLADNASEAGKAKNRRVELVKL